MCHCAIEILVNVLQLLTIYIWIMVRVRVTFFLDIWLATSKKQVILEAQGVTRSKWSIRAYHKLWHTGTTKCTSFFGFGAYTVQNGTCFSCGAHITKYVGKKNITGSIGHSFGYVELVLLAVPGTLSTQLASQFFTRYRYIKLVLGHTQFVTSSCYQVLGCTHHASQSLKN